MKASEPLMSRSVEPLQLRKTSSGGRVFPFAKAQKNGCFATIGIDDYPYKTGAWVATVPSMGC
jgi:hypothetical protein